MNRKFIFLCAALLPMLLSGCGLAVLNPKGIVAAHERTLLLGAVGLMLIVVIPVIVINFWFAWRYRASNKRAVYRPDDHQSIVIELVCWSVPVVIVSILAVAAWISSHKLDPYRPLNLKGDPIVIQAVSLNWKWLFIYPHERVAVINEVFIPVHRQIKFLVTSDAPMNALEIPQLAGQIYAMGGMQTKLHLSANTVGRYRGLSTSFSGDGFSGMNFKVHVVSQQQYQNWLGRARQSVHQLTWERYRQLVKDSYNNPVEYFSSVVPQLFHKIIMQFMMADKTMNHHTVHGVSGIENENR